MEEVSSNLGVGLRSDATPRGRRPPRFPCPEPDAARRFCQGHAYRHPGLRDFWINVSRLRRGSPTKGSPEETTQTPSKEADVDRDSLYAGRSRKLDTCTAAVMAETEV